MSERLHCGFVRRVRDRLDNAAAWRWRRREHKKRKRFENRLDCVLMAAGFERSPGRFSFSIRVDKLCDAPSPYRRLVCLLMKDSNVPMGATMRRDALVHIDREGAQRKIAEVVALDMAMRKAKWAGTIGDIRQMCWALLLLALGFAFPLFLCWFVESGVLRR